MNPATFNFLIELFENISNDIHATDATRDTLDRSISNIVDNIQCVIQE